MIFREFLKVARDLADETNEAWWRSRITEAIKTYERDVLKEVTWRR